MGKVEGWSSRGGTDRADAVHSWTRGRSALRKLPASTISCSVKRGMVNVEAAEEIHFKKKNKSTGN
jgi:hypothetical protein